MPKPNNDRAHYTRPESSRLMHENFANTLALTSFPLRIGSIYGSGLFWCKEDDTLLRSLLLTATSFSAWSRCGGPSFVAYIERYRRLRFYPFHSGLIV
jgi:hypothetical protein